MPPEKPDVTDSTPFNNCNCASTHQKHPAPKVAVSIVFAVNWGSDCFDFEVSWSVRFCAQDITAIETRVINAIFFMTRNVWLNIAGAKVVN